jgi:hypothetical protein
MTWLWPEGCEGAGDKSLTSFSIDGERCLYTSSEATQSLSNGLRGGSKSKGRLQKP